MVFFLFVLEPILVINEPDSTRMQIHNPTHKISQMCDPTRIQKIPIPFIS